jgi:hypothetical protein
LSESDSGSCEVVERLLIGCTLVVVADSGWCFAFLVSERKERRGTGVRRRLHSPNGGGLLGKSGCSLQPGFDCRISLWTVGNIFPRSKTITFAIGNREFNYPILFWILRFSVKGRKSAMPTAQVLSCNDGLASDP